MESISSKQVARVQENIRCLLSIHDDHQFTARAVAHILHGIASPNYPAKVGVVWVVSGSGEVI